MALRDRREAVFIFANATVHWRGQCPLLALSCRSAMSARLPLSGGEADSICSLIFSVFDPKRTCPKGHYRLLHVDARLPTPVAVRTTRSSAGCSILFK